MNTSPAMSLTISDVSKKTGIAASALRYYEEKGLIRPVGRKGQKRLYRADVLERLALILLGQAAGFSLDEIRDVMTPDGYELDREQLREKAEEIEQQITKLMILKEGLLHAAACNAPSHAECPTFQDILQTALDKRKDESEHKLVNRKSHPADNKQNPG